MNFILQVTGTGVTTAGQAMGYHISTGRQKYDKDDAEFRVDYAFMTKELEKYMSEPEKVGATPILVGRDHRSKAIWAMAVNMKDPLAQPSNGSQERSARRDAEESRWCSSQIKKSPS